MRENTKVNTQTDTGDAANPSSQPGLGPLAPTAR